MTSAFPAPGVYAGVPMDEYLRAPAVSASIIRTLLDECPRAAWFQSWLNPEPPDPDDTAASDKGSIAHQILLEGSQDCCVVIDPNDHATTSSGNVPTGWTNKSIRAARDEARHAGKIPILAPVMDEIGAMVRSAQSFIASLKDSDDALAVRVHQAFQPDGGDSELTVVWQDGPTLCRIRPDRTSNNRELVVDAKFTGTCAEPDAWGRTQMIRMGYYTSAAFYRRGIRQAFDVDVDADYVFLVVETVPPYLCSLVGVDPHGFELGSSKVAAGLDLWAQCVKRDRWPAYPSRVVYPEIPSWEDSRWEERQMVSLEERFALGSQA